MKDLIEQIESVREERGLYKADMARAFGVPEQNYNNWVYRKSLPKQQISRAMEILSDDGKSNTAPASIQGWIPLISYVQAGEWSEAIDLYEPGYGEKVMPTTAPHSSSTFALRVEGRSMTLPDGVTGISFPHGMIIYVDPEMEAMPGDYVVARHGDNHVTFKKLMMEEGRPVLMPLNPDSKQYPVIRCEFEIIGKVIDGSWGGI